MKFDSQRYKRKHTIVGVVKEKVLCWHKERPREREYMCGGYNRIATEVGMKIIYSSQMRRKISQNGVFGG
jgi:hypothetical protein